MKNNLLAEWYKWKTENPNEYKKALKKNKKLEKLFKEQERKLQ